ncbi:MAG: hypothetical protein MZV49_13445 [Rhodopseudomonas palustris]|nr:hypothetical protein [Rhodopseudomonas palustris]
MALVEGMSSDDLNLEGKLRSILRPVLLRAQGGENDPKREKGRGVVSMTFQEKTHCRGGDGGGIRLPSHNLDRVLSPFFAEMRTLRDNQIRNVFIHQVQRIDETIRRMRTTAILTASAGETVFAMNDHRPDTDIETHLERYLKSVVQAHPDILRGGGAVCGSNFRGLR